MIAENEDYNIHLIACKKSSTEIPKDCISGNSPEKITDNASKGPNLQNLVDINSTVPTPQNECHPNVMQPVNLKFAFDNESNSPSNMGGKLSRSNLKSWKGNQKKSIGSKSFAKDKDNEHSSAAAAFKNLDENKLKRKSSMQAEKKHSDAKGAGNGTKRKLKFDIYVSFFFFELSI